MTWSHFEVEELVQRILKKERDQVDDILAKRQEECYCARPDSPQPCDDCLEIMRLRNTFEERNSRLKGGPG